MPTARPGAAVLSSLMAVEIIAPALALLMPVFLVFLHKYFRYKEKLLELQARGGGPPLLAAGEVPGADNRLAELEERVQNLESIIVAMDTELGALPERAPREELRRLRGKTPAPALPAPRSPNSSGSVEPPEPPQPPE